MWRGFSFALWVGKRSRRRRRLWSLDLRDSSLIYPSSLPNASAILQCFDFVTRGGGSRWAAWSWGRCLGLVAIVLLWSALLPRSHACQRCGTSNSPSLSKNPPLPGDPWFAHQEQGSRLLSTTLGCRDPCLNNESRAPLPKAGSTLMVASGFCARWSPSRQSQLDGAASRSETGLGWRPLYCESFWDLVSSGLSWGQSV